jgi:hypothetical protein
VGVRRNVSILALSGEIRQSISKQL